MERGACAFCTTPAKTEIAGRAACTAGEEADPGGATLVVVRCSGSVPSLLAALGNVLPLEVTGRSMKEAA